jgi:hypothetical protein
VPAGHAVQVSTPGAEPKPDELPMSEYLPLGQAVHELAPGASPLPIVEKVPAGHAVQLAEDCAE